VERRKGPGVKPRQRFVRCASPRGLHRMSYLEWGDPRNERVLVCVHGLTRCARDFDALAAAMSDKYRVACPDVAGRGDSEWLADPMLYQLPQYLSDMVTLIARLDVEQVEWLGTSMGALIGMALAAQKGTPVAKLVVNDAGPVIAKAALERIATYVGLWPPLPSLQAAEQLVRAVSASFGPHTDEEWRFLTEVVVRKNADGGYRFHYDPKIAEPLRRDIPAADVEVWPVWDAVRCPTLVIHGAQSDLLSKATAEQMTQRGPKARLVELPGIGHAPTLLHADQISLVREFLLS
jgi:pimeloyl-ACP methyl ester carboxylesterase